jgi:hypothetical protein
LSHHRGRQWSRLAANRPTRGSHPGPESRWVSPDPAWAGVHSARPVGPICPARPVGPICPARPVGPARPAAPPDRRSAAARPAAPPDRRSAAALLPTPPPPRLAQVGLGRGEQRPSAELPRPSGP